MEVQLDVGPENIGLLYSSHHGWLRDWLRKRLGCSQKAADVVQDTFVRLLGTAASAPLAPVREPRRFLVTVAKRVMVDSYRRTRLEKSFISSLALEPELESVSVEERHALFEKLLLLDAMLDGVGIKAKEAL